MLRRWITIAAISLMATAVALAPPPAQANPQMMLAAAVALFTVGLWATAVIPEHLTSLALFLLAIVLSIAPPEVVFSGFHSSAIWLIFGGFVLGAAAEKNGVGQWIAAHIIQRVGDSYRSIIIAITLGGIVMAFLIPSSMGRIMLLLPIVQSFAKEAGFEPHSSGRYGCLLALLLGTYLVPMTILPANLPNVILLGSADTLYQHVISYGRYLSTHFPISGVAKAGAGILLIWWLFPAATQTAAQTHAVPRLTTRGRVLLGLLALTLILWMTDSLHGVSPGWISLFAAVVCMLPGVDLLGERDFQTRVSLAALIYTAGSIALGAVVATSGIGALGAQLMTDSLELVPQQDFRNYLVLSLVSIGTTLLVTMGGVMPVLTPVASGLAEATGWSLETVLMVYVNGTTNPILPYVAGPIVVALRATDTRFRVAARLLVPLAVVSIAVFVPLNYLWWRWLGYFG